MAFAMVALTPDESLPLALARFCIAGVGFGLTDPADNLVVKSILSWEFF